MELYSNLSSPLVLKSSPTDVHGSLPPTPPWLSRPKEERPLLRSSISGTPFNLGGPGSFPRRDSASRVSVGIYSSSESSMQPTSSSFDPYSSPITAEDLRNRYMRDYRNSQVKNDDNQVKLRERTYMSSSPNPFLVKSFIAKKENFFAHRPSSSSSVPSSVQSSVSDKSKKESAKPLVETGVLRPRRATTATSRFRSNDQNDNNSSFHMKADENSMNSPVTNTMTMFSVMTKRPPQRMVEHSTSVYSSFQGPTLNSSLNNSNFRLNRAYGSYNNVSDVKEDCDGAESHEFNEKDEVYRPDSVRMPVTGTVTSTTLYPGSSKCEDLIYRPQSIKESEKYDFSTTMENVNSESLYDKVKREVENHRKARQLALAQEKEMDERQKQIMQTKFSISHTNTDKDCEMKSQSHENTSSSVPCKQLIQKDLPPNSNEIQCRIPSASVKETIPLSLSSTAGSLQKAILPNRTIQQIKSHSAEVNNKPIRKTSIDQLTNHKLPISRLNVSTRGPAEKQSAYPSKAPIKNVCPSGEEEAAELGERQPGDGEADIGDDERTIKTEYTHSSRSTSRCSSVDSVHSDIMNGSSSDDDDDDDDDELETGNFQKNSQPTSMQTSTSSVASPSHNTHLQQNHDVDSDSDNDKVSDDSDGDVTDMDSSSDESVDRSRSSSRVSSRRSRSMSDLSQRRVRRRTKSSSSTEDEDDDDDDDDGDSRPRQSLKGSPHRRSMSATRVRIPSGNSNKNISKEKTSEIKNGLTRNGSSRKGKGFNPLIDSCFDNIAPCLRFVVDGEKVEQLPWKYRKLLIWRMSTLTPVIVKQTIWRSGFRASKMASVIDDVETHDTNDWIGYFGKHMRPANFKCLREYQKYNHYPGSHQLGRKDRLWQNLHHMQQVIGKKEYNFFPQTFCLPTDAKLLKKAWDEEGGHKVKWILKPPASARGQGIRVVHQWCQIPKKSNIIVQKYLSRPYLINESKFDLRVYVYVPSFDPLRIYIHEDGLVRFASQKYSTSVKNLANRFMHLTNYSINKQNTEYQSNSDDSQCQGHKWSLRALWSYMRRRGHNVDVIWEQIKDIIIKTIISVEVHINSQVKMFCRRKYSVHELFGFDILLDESLQPWVLECNISPSLHSNSKLDINIKGEMIKDMFNLAGFQIPDRLESGQPPASYTPSCDIVCDRRLWYTELGSDEKSKHSYFVTRAEQGLSISSILDIITPEDLRILIESVDEFSRAGSFQQVFPISNTKKYMKFFEKPRYANLLLHAYIQKFKGKEKQGIAWLNGMCQRKVHLLHGSKELRHRWRPTSTEVKKNSSTSNMSSSASDTGPFGDHS